MKERGKAVETYSASNFSDYNYSASEFPCKKHPSSSSVGICAYCLKDRLIKLVCSDCGEQRLSSCSCSEVSSYRNSCSAAEVGSVGRISFLMENERSETKQFSHSKPRNGVRSDEEVVMLKRSSSSCVGVKRSGLWRIVRLFRKKRDKNDMWVFDYMGVSRSRSLCSFRGGSFHDPEESSDFAFSSAKISDVNGGPLIDSERVSGFSGFSAEAEPRKSGFKVPIKESDFSGMDDSGFIDLKLDLSSEAKPEFSVLKPTEVPVSVSDLGRLRSRTSLGHNHECGASFGSLMGDGDGDGGILRKGGSCRVTLNDMAGIRREKKGHKVWRWIFRHHPNWRSTASKKDEIHVLKT